MSRTIISKGKHGGKRANSGGKRSGAGRKKGSPNKLTADVKAAIMAAFDQVGGSADLKLTRKMRFLQ